jgi:hypothetical protein
VTAKEIAILANVVSLNSAIIHSVFYGHPRSRANPADYTEEGDTLDSFLKDFSTVTREQAINSLSEPNN